MKSSAAAKASLLQVVCPIPGTSRSLARNPSREKPPLKMSRIFPRRKSFVAVISTKRTSFAPAISSAVALKSKSPYGLPAVSSGEVAATLGTGL